MKKLQQTVSINVVFRYGSELENQEVIKIKVGGKNELKKQFKQIKSRLKTEEYFQVFIYEIWKEDISKQRLLHVYSIQKIEPQYIVAYNNYQSGETLFVDTFQEAIDVPIKQVEENLKYALLIYHILNIK